MKKGWEGSKSKYRMRRKRGQKMSRRRKM